MAKQNIIGQDISYINIRFYKSRAFGLEGQEFVTVNFGGKKYNYSACQNEGVTDALVDWMNDEIKDNELAQKVLNQVLEENDTFSGVGAIRKNEDGTFKVKNVGENQVMQLLRSLGITLKSVKSSTRSNAYLVGYNVNHNGVEIAEDNAEV